MSDIYITGGGDSLPGVLAAYYGNLSPEEYQQRQEWTIAANPWLNSSALFKPGLPLFLPNSSAELACTRERAEIEAAWEDLSGDGHTFLVEGLRNNDPGFLEELLALLDMYEVVNTTGYVNTFSAGAVGGMTSRASHLSDTLMKVEGVLREYAEARPMERGALKPKVRAAYAQMNEAFGMDLQAAAAKMKAKGRLGPMRSSRQGMQRAALLAQKGSRAAIVAESQQALRVIKLAKYGRVLGNGMVVLDLGIRVHNVVRSENQVRTGVSEGLGFAASFGAGAVAYGKCLAPAAVLTGPWSLVICLVPAGGAALIADEVGKKVGASAYDLVAQ